MTEAGCRYAAAVAEVLGRLDSATNELAPITKAKRLRISVPDFVAHLYVLPALSRFREQHPQIDLEISATMELADLDGGKVDAAVRIGPGTWNGLRAFLITPLGGTAVAAPVLAARAADACKRNSLPIVCLSSLEDHTRDALRALGLCAEPERVLRVDNYMAVVQAASEGLGIALVYAPPNKAIDFDGRLLPVSDSPLTPPFAAYFVCRAKDAERSDLALLREWLTECISK